MLFRFQIKEMYQEDETNAAQAYIRYSEEHLLELTQIGFDMELGNKPALPSDLHKIKPKKRLHSLQAYGKQ